MSSVLIAKRGEFHAYQVSGRTNNVTEVYLGAKEDHESEYIMAICTESIPELIATLRMAEGNKK